MVLNDSLLVCHILLASARICLAFLCPRSCVLHHWLAWFMSYLTSISYCVTAPTAISVTNCSVLPLCVWSIVCGYTPYRREVWAKAMVTYLFIHVFAPPLPRFILLFLFRSGSLWFPVSQFYFTTLPLARPLSICGVFFIWLLGFPAWWIFYCSSCFLFDMFRIFILLLFCSLHSIIQGSPKLSSAHLSHSYYCNCPFLFDIYFPCAVCFIVPVDFHLICPARYFLIILCSLHSFPVSFERFLACLSH